MASVLLSLSTDDVVVAALANENNAGYLFGVDVIKERSEDSLKRIYKRLALKVHPDKNTHTDAGKAFQVLQAMFEATLAAFAAPPPPAAAARHSAPQPQHSSAQRQQQSYPPPPPPSTASRRPADSRSGTKHTSEFDDIPLPPDVFADVAWDDWTDKDDANKKHKTSGKSRQSGTSFPPPPPPPPPPAHQHTFPPPPPPRPQAFSQPPPPPPQSHCSPTHYQTTKETREHAVKLDALPELDVSSDEDSFVSASRQQKKHSTRERKGTGVLPSLSDEEADEASMEAEIRRRYQSKLFAKKQQEAQRREEGRKQQAQVSAKTLRQLFAEFGISDDEESVDVAGAVGKKKKPLRQSGEAASSSPRSSAQQTAQWSSSVNGTQGQRTAPIQQGRPDVAQCPNCGSEVLLQGPLAAAQTVAVMCATCRKFFVPAAVAGGGRKSASSVGGGERCRCGKAKRGHCFMCE